MKYVLITPVRNEEKFIENTLRSMAAQTVQPERWVIVDDGSTDGTLRLIQKYAAIYPWIEVVQRQQRQERSFSGKVDAFNAGWDRVRTLSFEVIGNLDGDLSFDPDYLEFLMSKFAQDPQLGVTGTPFTEDGGYDTALHSFEGENYVAGGCQLFRYQCFQQIGGYVPNKDGGVDWIAVMAARMQGWKVRSFAEKRFHHHRSLGTAEQGYIGAMFQYGERAYYLGGSPIWHTCRCLFRMTRKPFVTGGASLMAGYLYAALKRTKRPVSRDMIRFHRREQMRKLRTICKAVVRRQKVDSFRLAPE
jgi:poly-beta-1,6-N-acetyl-D-glucosamine synthase